MRNIHKILILSTLFLNTACNNLYHGLTQIPLFAPMSASFNQALNIIYTYPSNNEKGVGTNRSVLVSFNKTIDESCVYDGLVTVAKKDGVREQAAVKGSAELYEGSLLIFTPEENLQPSADYRVRINGDIKDFSGNKTGKGRSWCFSTSALTDTVPPEVVGFTHDNKKIQDPDEGMFLYFSEDIDPSSLGGIVIKDKTSGEKTGLNCDYSGEDRAVIIKPLGLRDNRLYALEVSSGQVKVTDIARNPMTRAYAFNFSTGELSKRTDRLEDASNLDHGFGTFGDCDGSGPMIRGHVLKDARENVLLAGYPAERMDLSRIFDSGVEGEYGNLSDGKSFTITINGKNPVTDLGMTPLTKLIDYNNIVSPPPKEFNVDLSNGSFIFQRPFYWCRMESIDDIINPTIAPYGIIPTIEMSGTGSATSELMKYNYGFGARGYYNLFFQYPFFINITPLGNKNYNLNKVTLSAFIRLTGRSFTYLTIYIGNIQYHHNYDTHSLYIDLPENSEFNPTQPPESVWCNTNQIYKLHHLYLLINNNGDFKKNTVKIYIDGIERLRTNKKINNDNAKIKISLKGFDLDGCALIDNLKIWQDVVSDGPNAAKWEYENQYEDGLHPVYGKRFNYRPEYVRVGYYR
ncbi:MAG: Ig-like domain-containing protein [Spirochaetes bacterium]|jgi:hypothetical protein|nr:Ig-like domain-containing protein [Spirochaetota bacterium]